MVFGKSGPESPSKKEEAAASCFKERLFLIFISTQFSIQDGFQMTDLHAHTHTYVHSLTMQSM